MKNKKVVGYVSAGLIAGLVLGSIGIASAATLSSRSTTSSAETSSTQAGRGFDRGGRHGGPGGPGGRDGVRGMRGGGVFAEALAALTGKDASTFMDKRAAGTSFAAQAKAAGISEAELIAKATALVKADLDAAVKGGRMTAAQRTEALKNLKAHLTEELTETHAIGRGKGGPGGPEGARGMRGGGVFAEALAALTKKDASTFMDKRAAGTSFAAQAKAAGISEDELIAKATALVKADLDAAVKDGRMTAAQRTEALKNLKAHLTEELTETHAIGRGPGAPGTGGSGTGTGTDGTTSGTSSSGTAPSTSTGTSDSTVTL